MPKVNTTSAFLTRRLSQLFVCLLLPLALLIGCSSLRLFYQKLDWLLPYYLADYVSLDADQAARLDRQVDQLLVWHCQTQIPQYSQFFQTLIQDVRDGRYQPAVLRSRFDTTSVYWYKLTTQTAEHIAPVLIDTSDEQVTQIFHKLADDHAEFRRKFVEGDTKALGKALAEQTTERIERWLGDLQPEQAALVGHWAEQAIPLQAERLAARQRWQQALRQAFATRQQGLAVFTRALKAVFAEPQQYWTDVYRESIQRYRNGLFDLLEAILSRMTEVQKTHLQERLKSMLADMQRLSCVAPSNP